MRVPKMLVVVLQLYGSLGKVECRSSPSRWSGFCYEFSDGARLLLALSQEHDDARTNLRVVTCGVPRCCGCSKSSLCGSSKKAIVLRTQEYFQQPASRGCADSPTSLQPDITMIRKRTRSADVTNFSFLARRILGSLQLLQHSSSV